MRTTTALMFAAAIIATPAIAQDNLVAGNTSAADAGTLANNDAAFTTVAPLNGMTADPGAAPMTTDTAMADPSYGEAAADGDEDDRFPWGLLGLVGLAGLLGRRRRDDSSDDRTPR